MLKLRQPLCYFRRSFCHLWWTSSKLRNGLRYAPTSLSLLAALVDSMAGEELPSRFEVAELDDRPALRECCEILPHFPQHRRYWPLDEARDLLAHRCSATRLHISFMCRPHSLLKVDPGFVQAPLASEFKALSQRCTRLPSPSRFHLLCTAVALGDPHWWHSSARISNESHHLRIKSILGWQPPDAEVTSLLCQCAFVSSWAYNDPGTYRPGHSLLTSKIVGSAEKL